MIFIDTETTGLLKAEAADLSLQPHITEIYAVRLDDDYKFISELETFVKPPIPIPEEITKITGITDAMIADAPSFIRVYDDLVSLFLGEAEVIGHNIPFDMGMLYCELARTNLEYHFPWPKTWTCTVEKSMSIENKRLRLVYLHELATGSPHENAHRAKNDVMAVVRCHIWLRKKGLV